MVASEQQKPLCPVCHKSDQVMTLQAAYESGIERFAPPPMPVGKVPMMKTMAIGVGLVTVIAFFIIVLLAPNIPDYLRWVQVVLSIAGIIIILALSFLLFRRISQGDLDSQRLLPSWDRALANWGRLLYCKRDNIVFDPQQASPRPLPDDVVSSLLSVEAQHEAPAQVSTMATHQ